MNENGESRDGDGDVFLGGSFREPSDTLPSISHIERDNGQLEELRVAMNATGQPELLIQHFEKTLPGVISRSERWYNLAVGHYAIGQSEMALECLRKVLSTYESPKSLKSLLLAAVVCATLGLGEEGAEYAERAIEISDDEEDKWRGLHRYGVNAAIHARKVFSNEKREKLRENAVKALEEAGALSSRHETVLFDLALEYAHQGSVEESMKLTTELFHIPSQRHANLWKLFVLLLAAQQRLEEAEKISNLALKQIDCGSESLELVGLEGIFSLLRVKAKVLVAAEKLSQAMECYKQQLGIVKKHKEAFDLQQEEKVWEDLAELYVLQKQWADAQTCVEKALEINPYSVDAFLSLGLLEEAQRNQENAVIAYENALAVDPYHAPSKTRLAAVFVKSSASLLPLGRSHLKDALQTNPGNCEAWLILGKVHEREKRDKEAASCLLASAELARKNPPIPVEDIPWALCSFRLLVK